MDNNNYTIKSLKPAIIIFIISVIIISIIYTIMSIVISNNRQQDFLKRKNSATNTNQPNPSNPKPTTGRTHKGNLTIDNIKDDLSSSQNINISQQEYIDKWVIIIVEPTDHSTDPALLIYHHVNDTYKRVLGPGTLFTRQNFTDQKIPNNVIDKSLIIKKFLSSQPGVS